MENFDYIKRNLELLREELATLSARLGTPLADLVCVTKSGTDEELLALAGFGASDFGENRPQEVKRRAELLLANGLSPRMHEIGNLQRNKVKLIADTAYMVHSVDSVKLASDIGRLCTEKGIVMPVLIEINSAREPQKGGVMPEACEEFLHEISEIRGISPRGLMTMGPVVSNPEEIRPYFKLTRKLFDSLISRFDGEPVLSMGMSDSYACAIEEGSTLVRVGRRLFYK